MLEQALGRLANDLAIDLGTSNTLVFVRGRGIVVEEPSVVAIRQEGKASVVVAVGVEAKRMLGRTPEHLIADCPLKDGRVSDYGLAEALLQDCVHRALTTTRPLIRPRMVISMPQGITDVERRAVTEAARNAGAKEVYVVSKSIAAALGAGLPIHEARANLVVDIGGGTAEVGIVSIGGVVDSDTIGVGGQALDEAIARWLQAQLGILVGDRTAEEIKIAAGAALPDARQGEVRITGQDHATGMPREFTVSSAQLAQAMGPCLEQIVTGLQQVLGRLTPELSADVADTGMVLCGGTAYLPGLDRFFAERTGLNVTIADDPRRCTALGAGQLLEDERTLLRVAL